MEDEVPEMSDVEKTAQLMLRYVEGCRARDVVADKKSLDAVKLWAVEQFIGIGFLELVLDRKLDIFVKDGEVRFTGVGEPFGG